MASNSVVRFGDFRPSDIQFDAVSKTKKGAKLIKLFYGASNDRILIQTPILRLPFGLSQYEEANGPPSLSFDASLDQERDDVVMFVEVLRQIEQIVVAHCKHLVRELFGNNTSPELVESLFKSPMRPSSQPDKYPPLLKIKVPDYVTADEKHPHWYNSNHEEICIEDFRGANSEVKFIINLSSIWFVNKSFGISCKLWQACLVRAPTISKYGFHDDDTSKAPATATIDLVEEEDEEDE